MVFHHQPCYIYLIYIYIYIYNIYIYISIYKCINAFVNLALKQNIFMEKCSQID